MRNRRWQLFQLAGLVILTVSSANACQESCVEYQAKAGQIKVVGASGEAMPHAGLIIRMADLPEHGRKVYCGKAVGEVIRKEATGTNGDFRLTGLADGFYWVTYDDNNAGESFLIELKRNRKTGVRQLKLATLGGLCHLVDLEHNTTRPPSDVRPISVVP